MNALRFVVSVALLVLVAAGSASGDIQFTFNTGSGYSWQVANVDTATLENATYSSAYSISPASTWVKSVSWISSSANGASANETAHNYAYKLTLTPEAGTIGSVASGQLSLSYAVDNYLDGVFLNGLKIYTGFGYDATDQYSTTHTINGPFTLENAINATDVSELVFVIHNGGGPTGFAISSGTLSLILQEPPSTPEPATLLILGLGLAGLGLARRRK